MTNSLPATGIELVGLAILTLGGLISLRIQTSNANKQLTAANRKITEMHEQVRNSHPQQPNMRDDLDTTRDTASDIHAIVRDMQDRQIAQDAKLGTKLDALRADLRADITATRADINGVRTELHDERERSISVDASLWRAINSRTPGGGTAGSGGAAR